MMVDTTCTEITIGEVLKQWCTMPQEVLNWAGVRLYEKLCPVSHQSIAAFQHDWDGDRPFEEFQKAQAHVLLECVAIEISELGKTVRKTLGMDEEISMDTVLYKDLDAQVDAEAEKSEYEDNMGEGEL